MKFLVLLASLVAFSYASAIFDASLDNSWLEFQKTHNKVYGSPEEATKRRLIWESNLKYIRQHNMEYELGHHTFNLKMNKYGDLTNKEFVQMLNGYNATKQVSLASGQGNLFVAPENVEIPDSVDWRTLGYVTPIKDQGKTIHQLFAFETN